MLSDRANKASSAPTMRNCCKTATRPYGSNLARAASATPLRSASSSQGQHRITRQPCRRRALREQQAAQRLKMIETDSAPWPHPGLGPQQASSSPTTQADWRAESVSRSHRWCREWVNSTCCQQCCCRKSACPGDIYRSASASATLLRDDSPGPSRNWAARLMKPVSPCAVDYANAVLQDSKAIKPSRIRILGFVSIMVQLRR